MSDARVRIRSTAVPLGETLLFLIRICIVFAGRTLPWFSFFTVSHIMQLTSSFVDLNDAQEDRVCRVEGPGCCGDMGSVGLVGSAGSISIWVSEVFFLGCRSRCLSSKKF